MSAPYRGGELDVFAHAAGWKAYFGSHLRDALVGDVLEVGAGIGAATRALCDGRQRSWTCLEADAALAARLREGLQREPLPRAPGQPLPEVIVGALPDLAPGRAFDAILYVDVLEHIGDDAGELRQAAARLRPGGALMVVAPAHRWLYTPFDAAIGHFRRYDRASLRALTPPGLTLTTLRYLDAAGVLLSLANRLLLRSATPTVAQIRFWDRRVVPISRRLDPLLGYRAGKSILAVWRRG